MKTTLLFLTLAIFALVPLQVQADGEPETTPPAAATGCEFSHLVGKKPGQMVTMEYLEGRINLQVDDAGVITAVTCG